jgi:hypothetical protein
MRLERERDILKWGRACPRVRIEDYSRWLSTLHISPPTVHTGVAHMHPRLRGSHQLESLELDFAILFG